MFSNYPSSITSSTSFLYELCVSRIRFSSSLPEVVLSMKLIIILMETPSASFSSQSIAQFPTLLLPFLVSDKSSVSQPGYDLLSFLLQDQMASTHSPSSLSSSLPSPLSSLLSSPHCRPSPFPKSFPPFPRIPFIANRLLLSASPLPPLTPSRTTSKLPAAPPPSPAPTSTSCLSSSPTPARFSPPTWKPPRGPLYSACATRRRVCAWRCCVVASSSAHL